MTEHFGMMYALKRLEGVRKKIKTGTGMLAVLLITAILTGCGIRSGQQWENTDPVMSLPVETADASGEPRGEGTQPSTAAAEPEETEHVPDDPAQNAQDASQEGSTFEIHFIDVGQGDAALVLCDGQAMLIDGGESSASSKIYSYLKSHGVDYLDYIVATHVHSDHVGGLSGALNYAAAGTAFCPDTEYDSRAFQSFVEYLDQQGRKITVPQAGDTFSLGSSMVQILGPQRDYENINDTSVVLKISYGKTAFLFTGDAERTAEADILDAGYDLSATVLKVGHHGSDTSTSYPFLREIMPQYAVISVGEGNSYGHPNENLLSRLRDAGVKVYRTDLQGTILCTSDGEQVSFQVEKNEGVQTNPTETTAQDAEKEITYIGNRNSKKFHLPACPNLPIEKNRVSFASRQEAIDAGFDPCDNCKP